MCRKAQIESEGKHIKWRRFQVRRIDDIARSVSFGKVVVQEQAVAAASKVYGITKCDYKVREFERDCILNISNFKPEDDDDEVLT